MSRAGAFLVVGAGGLLVQISSLAALTALADWHWLPATIVSVELAVVHNFVWHERWTWRDRAESPGAHPTAARAVRFLRFNAASGLASLAGSTVLMALFAGAAGLPPVPASLLTVALLSAPNFVVADRWVFRRDSRPRLRAPARRAE